MRPFARLTDEQLVALLEKAQQQLIDEGPVSIISWTDGRHSETKKEVPILEWLAMLNAEMDLRGLDMPADTINATQGTL